MNKLLLASVVVFSILVGDERVEAQLIQVTIAPPAMRVEATPPPPGPGQAWVAGFWAWGGSQYVWTPGQWEQPPQPMAVWQRPRWERRQRHWGFTPGQWMRPGMRPGAVPPQTVFVAPGVPAAVPVFVPGRRGRGRGERGDERGRRGDRH
jgi:hypothetical protein